MMKRFSLLLALLLVTGCLTSSTSRTTTPGTRQIGDHVVLHEGPELVALVGFSGASRGLGEEWLVLGVELTSPRGGGPVVLRRDNISVRTPRGRRLPLILQTEYRGLFPGVRIPVERALLDLPLLDRYHPNRTPCNQWFLVAGEHVALDQIPVSSFDVCSGPLVFMIPGGVQPGPWRLIIELEESRASIPFLIQ